MVFQSRTARGRCIPLVICVGALTALAGCKKDNDSDRTAASPGTTAGASAAAGASGARAGAGGGVVGAGGTTAQQPQQPPAPPAPVMCGGATCMAPAGSRLMPCCLPSGGCGLGAGGECQEANQPGDVDARCPSHEVAMAGLTLEGCCKPDNVCGVMSVSGLGCVDRTKLGTFAGGPLDARTCSEGGDATDAGVEEVDGGAGEQPSDQSGDEDAGVGSERCVRAPWWARRWQWMGGNNNSRYCPGSRLR